MIRVRFRCDPDGRFRLTIRGHGGLAPYGQDLLCAAVSTLALTAEQLVWAQYRRGSLQSPPETVLEPGHARIVLRPKVESRTPVRRQLHVICMGLRLLEEAFPHHVQLRGHL